MKYECQIDIALPRARVVELGPESTRWIAENEFRLSGLMRVMGLFRGMFRKQTSSFMRDVKDFAETGADVRE